MSLKPTENIYVIKFCRDLVQHALKGGRLHLVLDFDGTFAPFHPNPEKSRADSGALRALYSISRHHNCVITLATGRSVESIRRCLGKSLSMPLPFNIIGSDGAEWQAAGQRQHVIRHPHPDGSEILMAEFNRVAQEMSAQYPGLVVEHKHGSILFNTGSLEEQDEDKRFAVMNEIRQALAKACANPAMPLINGVPYFQLYEIHGNHMGVHVPSFDKAFGLRQSQYADKEDRLVFFCDSLHQGGNDRTTAITVNNKVHYTKGSVVHVLSNRSQPLAADAPEKPHLVLRDVRETARFLKNLAKMLNENPPRLQAKTARFQ